MVCFGTRRRETGERRVQVNGFKHTRAGHARETLVNNARAGKPLSFLTVKKIYSTSTRSDGL